MALPSEVQASIIKVAGNWTQFLTTISPDKRRVVLARMLKRYENIHQLLYQKHEEEREEGR
jgi:hypothetical protein